MLSGIGDLPFTSLLKSAFALLGLWILLRVGLGIKRSFQIQRLAKAQGCGSVPLWRTYDPIFGLDHLWTIYSEFSAHKFLEGAVKRYIKIRSNTMRFSPLWGAPTISTIEPENLKTVLSSKFKDYSLDPYKKQALISITGEGIFASDGQFWHDSRALLKPVFSRVQIDDPNCFATHADDLMDSIWADSDGVVDLQPLFSSASLDIITEFLTGESARSLDPNKRKSNYGGKTNAEIFFDAFSSIVRSYDGQNGNYGVLSFFLPDSSIKKNKVVMDNYINGVIDRAIKDEKSGRNDESDQRYTLLADVVKSTQDRTRLRSELLNVLLAGRDTTESFLSSLFFTLSQRPDIFSKLQREIDDANIPLTPSFSQLKSLPYLRACLNETERLYPSAPENDRTAVVDTILPVGGGPDQKSPVFVPKGATVHWSIFALHRRKDIYGDDADEFRPERWLDGPNGEKGLRVTWEYIPFSGGPRVCIGQQFALMEVSFLTVRLVREFEKMEAVEKRPWVEQATIVATVKDGVKVRVSPRQ